MNDINIKQRNELEQAIGAYGADSARWPEHLRALAPNARDDAALGRLMMQAAKLDAKLDELGEVPAYTVPQFDALPMQAVRKPTMKQQSGRLVRRYAGLGLLAAMWLYGVVILPDSELQKLRAPEQQQVAVIDEEFPQEAESEYAFNYGDEEWNYLLENLLTEESSDDTI